MYSRLNFTPEEFLNEVITNEDLTHQNINDQLKTCRDSAYAHHLNLRHAEDVIMHALTVNNIKKVNQAQLSNALKTFKNKMAEKVGPDPNVIMKLIIAAIELILEIIEYLKYCKNSNQNKLVLMARLCMLENNPFLNLAGVHLSNMPFNAALDLRWANFEGARLDNVNLHGSNLSHANFTGAVLNHVCLQNTTQNQTQWLWADLKTCTMNEEALSHLACKAFLQTRYPLNAKADKLPDPLFFLGLLDEIKKEIDIEKINDHEMTSRMTHKFDHYKHYMLLAKNIVTALSQASHISNEDKLILFKQVLKHPIFSEHKIARFTKKLDHAIGRLFHHDQALPYFGTPPQNILIHEMKKYESMMKRAENASPAPI